MKFKSRIYKKIALNHYNNFLLIKIKDKFNNRKTNNKKIKIKWNNLSMILVQKIF
jgi:hypothetical protein